MYICVYYVYLDLALPNYDSNQNGQHDCCYQYEYALLFTQFSLIDTRLPYLRSTFTDRYFSSFDRSFYRIDNLSLIINQSSKIFEYLINIANVTLYEKQIIYNYICIYILYMKKYLLKKYLPPTVLY